MRSKCFFTLLPTLLSRRVKINKVYGIGIYSLNVPPVMNYVSKPDSFPPVKSSFLRSSSAIT
jgi:hypothetical protein